jgi:hypothetical protein
MRFAVAPARNSLPSERTAPTTACRAAAMGGMSPAPAAVLSITIRPLGSTRRSTPESPACSSRSWATSAAAVTSRMTAA